MAYRQSFTFHELPRTQPDVLQKWARVQYRKQWRDRVVAETLGKLPPEPLKRAKVTLTRASSASKIDADGASPQKIAKIPVVGEVPVA